METKEDRNKRLLATGMSIFYFVIQTINVYICIQQYAVHDKVGYFICIMVLFTLDKLISYLVLKKEKFGYEILILDMLNLGFISIYLKRYPPFYRPMYGAKLFFIIIPTVSFQLVFFFGRDMIDQTSDKEIQVLMLISYIGYQLLQVRCFLALRMEYNRTIKQFVQMVVIYTLNVFSNYGIWLVFASHRDQEFEISLMFYGAILFIALVVYQTYQLYRLKDSTFLLNFLYNIMTSTNYTTEYGYYFHHYNNHFEDLFRERQNDLLIMSAYKTMQLLIYFTLGDVKEYKDRYQILNDVSNAMVVITFLDIACNMFQYFFGVRTIFHLIKTSKLSSTVSIAKAIMAVDKTKKYIYINNKAVSNNESGSLYQSERQQSYEMSNIQQSLSSSMDNRELKISSDLDNALAQEFLKHLTGLQLNHGCVLVEYPKLCVSSQKFDVSRYVNYAQLSWFFCQSDSIPSKTFDIHADWESIFMHRLMTKGLDIQYKNSDETYKYCVQNFLDVYLPMMILYKHYSFLLLEKPHQIITDLYTQ